MDSIVYGALQTDPNLIKRLVDFLPYPFLISVKMPGGLTNWFVNKQFREEIGFEREEIINLEKWFYIAYPDEAYRNSVRDQWYQKMEDAHKNGDSSAFLRVRIYTRNKGYQWYEVKASVTAKLEFVAFININEVIERDLELERINENKNQIISILGHDLRTPILNLNKLTEFIMDTKLSIDEFSLHVRKAHELSKSSLQFLETTLIWTRNNFTKITHTHTKIILKPWLEELLSLYVTGAGHKKVEVVLDVSPRDEIFSDPEILHIVTRNVLTNAIKFSPENSQVFVNVKRLNNEIEIVISDSGIGMSQEKVDAILSDESYTVDGYKVRDGFGMGLKLCQSVLKGVNGRLEITSKPNEGSTVSIFVSGNNAA